MEKQIITYNENNKNSSDMKKEINYLLLKMQNGENCIGETANELLILFSVSGSMADKAQMINALTNTMAVNKKELGGYHNLRDNSLEKLDKLIKSIDI